MSQASKSQFLACLLALLANGSCFYLMVGLVGLTVILFIGKRELIGRAVAISFSVYSL